MRKTTENVCNAFFAKRATTQGNTAVTLEGDSVRMYLHGNLIAHYNRETLLITLAGWPTPTTRERLNGLLEIGGYFTRVFQRDNKQWLGELRSRREITDTEVIKLDADEYACRACKRLELDCSRNPCETVVREREE